MAQDATGFIAALKEVWISETIEDQIYQGNPLLDALERIKPEAEHGSKAVIDVHVGRSGGYSAVPRTGSSSLNAADAQKIKKAEYTYTHHWFQVELETAVMDESSKSPLAVAKAVEVEMKGATDDIRKQLTRQGFTDGTARIANFEENTTTTTLKLDPDSLAYDAIRRGWIYPGLKVDIGSAASEASVAADREILEVDKDPAEPSIKISGANVSTAGTDFLSIANNRAGEVSNEMDGLPKLVNDEGVVGGINPTSVPLWAAPVNDTAQEISLEALYEGQDDVFQETGDEPDWALTSSKQYRLIYQQLQAQVRFNGDGNLGAGDKTGLKIGKTLIERQPDCPDRQFWFLTKKDLVAIRGDGPQWAAQKYGGSSSPVEYVQGTTKVKGALVYRQQMGVKRRNSHTGFTALK